MDIDQVARLLNDVNIKTICGTNVIEEYHGQSENYYKLEKTNEKWIFSFVKCERKTKGVEEVKKVFNNEQDASKYYYLVQLAKGYHNQYINQFKINDTDINIGEYECSIHNLKEAFDRLGIKESYYNFKSIKNEHSICLEEVDKDTSQVKFIGSGNKVITQTLPIENWLAYYTMYRRVYSLFLLDRHCELLIKNKEIESPFTDEEYSIFLK